MEKSPQGPGSAVGPALPRKEDSCADDEKYKEKPGHAGCIGWKCKIKFHAISFPKSV